MVFSSLIFLLIFFPVFFISYHFIDEKYKNGFALFASLVFYSWGAPDFFLIAIFSIVVDFYIVRLMHNAEGNFRKGLLTASITLNVLLLLYFKYFNFFIDNVNKILAKQGGGVDWVEIVLPIGISFFTFQKLSYSIDIYRRVEKPLSKLRDYMLYIMLFPQLIAGPIVRYKEIASQLRNRNFNDYNQKLQGFYRFSIGLGKKVIIANTLGQEADIIFSMNPEDLNASIAWLGIICYTFQIYFDFSAYSDMAIGLGLLMGFRFPENFNSPYISQSITEFWRRWHITLSSWMRDYLYIPLGGNRVKSNVRLYFNLWFVFLISGLWHGASWNFVIWGAFHGFFLVSERLFLLKITNYIGKLGRIILTFFIVVLGWVLFRSESFAFTKQFYAALFSFEFSSLDLFLDKKAIYILIIGLILSFTFVFQRVENMYTLFTESNQLQKVAIKSLLSIFLIVISISSLSSQGFNPFIYFRF